MVVFSCSRHQHFCEMSSKPMNAQNAIPPYPQRFLVGVNCQDGNIENTRTLDEFKSPVSKSTHQLVALNYIQTNKILSYETLKCCHGKIL